MKRNQLVNEEYQRNKEHGIVVSSLQMRILQMMILSRQLIDKEPQ